MKCYWTVELRYNALVLLVCCIYLWILKSMLLFRDVYTDDFSLPQGHQQRVLPDQQINQVLSLTLLLKPGKRVYSIRFKKAVLRQVHKDICDLASQGVCAHALTLLMRI